MWKEFVISTQMPLGNAPPRNGQPRPPPPPQLAAKSAAADRARANAAKYRASATSVDAIRARVKAEMKAEAQKAKQAALAKVAEAEAAEAARAAESEERRLAARREYSRALAEEREEEELQRRQHEHLSAQPQLQQQQQQQQQQQPGSAADGVPSAGGEPQSGTEDLLFNVEEEVGSQVERLQMLLRERAERRRDDSSADANLRQRLAARRHDPARFAAPPVAQPQAGGPDRSLFRWAPPPPGAGAASGADAPSAAATGKAAPLQPPPGMSDAARKAWEWANSRPAEAED